jgi:cobalt-zinc-cadmium efflux system membrane fusion protein
MAAWIRNIGAGIAGHIPTVLTLALLAALAIWGAQTGWKLPPLWGEPKDKPEETEKVTVKPVPNAGSQTSGNPSTPVMEIAFPSAATVRKAGIQVEPAQVRTMTQYVTANGMIDYVPDLYAQLSSPVNGKIWRVLKEFGAKVKKGDVLAIIDSAEVGKAKADLLQSLTMLDVRTTELNALRMARAAVPEGTLRKAESALRQARVRVFTDHQQLLNLGLPVRLEDLAKLTDEERVRHLRLLGLPREMIGKEIDPKTLTANLLPLMAPFDGRVVRHPHIAPGEVVNTAHPHTLFVVADVSLLHIEVEVNLEDVALTRLGQKVIFRPENKGGPEAEGILAHIGAEVNEKSRRVLVHAEVENKQGLLRPNTFGTGSILVGRRPSTVAVPVSAIQEMEEKPEEGKAPAPPEKARGRSNLVFVQVSETKFEARPVKLGIPEGRFVEVISGVRQGEKVVTTGGHALKSELLKDQIGGGDD